MPRQTALIEDILNFANSELRRTDQWSSAEQRQGVIQMIERILMDNGQYGGFRYLDDRELPADIQPGIRGCAVETPVEARFSNTDNTRRQYFMKKVKL